MKKIITKAATLLIPIALASCSSFQGSRDISQEKILPYGVTQDLPLNDKTIYYVGLEGLRIRSSGVNTQSSLGVLSLNDKVKVINPSVVSSENMVEITIVKTDSDNEITASKQYFVNKDYLSTKTVNYKEVKSKYFAIVNVASETLRLYERVCADNSCPHKMILETEVVAGEDTNHPASEPGKGRSVLGSYRITEWKKFYQDGAGHYPSWYKEGLPIPPMKSPKSWFYKPPFITKGKMYMPIENGKPHGLMRGAFGWYTAKVGPEAFGQWTHGTIGWGSDKDVSVTRTKGTLINIVSNPRSSGCTRNNNEAIAYIRKILELGAPIIKIYAREDILNKDISPYPETSIPWNYILTKSKSHLIDREDVLKSLGVTGDEVDAFWEIKKLNQNYVSENPKLNDILEVGTYDRDIHPDAITYNPGEILGSMERKTNRTGNVYGINSKDMQGTFYVDAGMIADYVPPVAQFVTDPKAKVLEISGFMDEITPGFISIKNLDKK